MFRNKAKTRKELIDKALQTVGGNLEGQNQVGIEIPVDGYNTEPWIGTGGNPLHYRYHSQRGSTGRLATGSVRMDFAARIKGGNI